MKFTDEQLSRILSTHAGGILANGGGTSSERHCIIQAAIPGTTMGGANRVDYPLVQKFDREYSSKWSTDRLLEWIEAVQ